MLAWTLFYNPMQLPSGGWSLWLLIPLCLTIAVVYKTVRTENLRKLPLEIVSALGYMLAGLTALGVGLWAAVAIFT